MLCLPGHSDEEGPKTIPNQRDNARDPLSYGLGCHRRPGVSLEVAA